MSQRDRESDRHLILVPLIAGGILVAACVTIFIFHFRSVTEARVPLSMLGGLCLGYAAVRLTVWMAARFYWIVGIAWIFASFVGAFLLFNVSSDTWVFQEGVREWDAMRAWAWLACGTMLSSSIVGLNYAVSRWRGDDDGGGSYFPPASDGGGGSGDGGG